jgi:hypothetical protein
MYESAESISRQKKERHCTCKKTLRLVVQGGNRTHDLSLEDAKSKGLNDLHESVRFDVMDLPDGQNLPYFNVSHRIIGGGGYEFRYKFSISHCNTTQYRCNTVISNNHRITELPYRPALLCAALGLLCAA